MAEKIDFYITHVGTMQHKIGWLFPNKPGLCFIRSRNPSWSAKWHKDQCEGSSELFYFPSNLIESDHSETQARAKRDIPIIISNESEAANHAVNIIERQACFIKKKNRIILHY